MRNLAFTRGRARKYFVQGKADVFDATLFYRHHIEAHNTPTEALRQAQLFVRSATKQQIVSWLAALRTMPGFSESLRRTIGHLSAEVDGLPREIPFDHPYYWAAFVATGA